MRTVVVVLVLVATACGGGGDHHGDAAVVNDSATIDDSATPDTPPIQDAAVDAKPDGSIVVTDASVDGGNSGTCNPLTQTGCAVGEKCTWLLDAVMPQYEGHIGCAPDGTAAAGDACMYGAPGVTGYDNCVKGTVCGNFRGGTGACKAICDHLGGQPQCASDSLCVTYEGLFASGLVAVAGLCETRCDPLADNDYDGSGALTKTGTTCGSSANVGCYGYPSFGTPPATGFSCTTDIHAMDAQPAGFRHRSQCTDANGCASGSTFYVNSCNQGYLPLLRESATISTVICVAMCKPMNCYQGNCGANDDNRLGMAPHRCNTTDRMGTFDTSAGGEHCLFSWFFEQDNNGNFLPSPTSNTVGFCFDHSKYLYDSDNNGVNDTPYPPCASLPDGVGSGTALGAADIGCVDTAHAGLMFWGKPHKRPDLRPLSRPTRM